MFCRKVSSWPREHPHVGWIHSCLIPPTALAGFQAQKSTKLPFSLAAAQLGTTGQALCVGSSCVCPWSALRGARRRAGPGPYGSLMLLKLQVSKDQLPEPSAILFLLGKQVLPWACPSVPKLS